MTDEDLQPGLYESLLTQGLAHQLENLRHGLVADFRDLDAGEAHDYFARHVASTLRELLRVVDEEGAERLRLQARACNSALEATQREGISAALVTEPSRLLAE